MKTIVKAAVGIGVLIVGGIVAAYVRRRKETQPQEQVEETAEQPKDVAVIVFDLETREMKLVRIPKGEDVGIGKEKIGIVNDLPTNSSWQAFKSKRNAKLIKESELTVEEIRSLWLYALETRSKGEEISKYIQETYMKESAEKVKEIVNQEGQQ